MENWACEVCKKIGIVGQDRAYELDNRPNPDDPYTPLHDIIHLCQGCHELGYILVRGVVRVWSYSPAHEQSQDRYPLVSGAQARFNPFHGNWPRGDGRAGLARSIGISRWKSQH